MVGVKLLGRQDQAVPEVGGAVRHDRVRNTGRFSVEVGHQDAAAGLVVASILEWPGLPDDQALHATIFSVRDYYRAKVERVTVSVGDRLR